MSELPGNEERPPMRRSARAIRATAASLALLTVALAVTEGMTQLVARTTMRLTPHRARLERGALLAKIPPDPSMAGGAAPGTIHRRYVDMAYGARYEIHPYFGHTMFRNFGLANNHGFYTDKRYPYVKGPREYVIGIFGGSVAMQIAGGGATLATRLRPALRERGFDDVTVLPFAAGGWRQPQSFNALVYYLDSIDMAILVDGFNDTVTLSPEQVRAYPARFPMQNIFAPLASDSQSSCATATAGKLAVAHRLMRRVTESLDASPFRNSILAHVAWRGVAAMYGRYVARLRAELEAPTADEWSGMEPNDDTERTIDAYLRLYANVARYGSVIAGADHKPFFHFVQPNQHDRGSKPLSEEERALVTVGWVEPISAAYRKLERISGELRAAGVDSTFLGHVFAATTETVYADSCCHFNTRGIDMLENAIADHVLASRALDGVPRVASGDDEAANAVARNR